MPRNVIVFNHRHLARAFALLWIDVPMITGHMFVQNITTLNILGPYPDTPAIVNWNAKIDPGKYHSDKVKAKPSGRGVENENSGH